MHSHRARTKTAATSSQTGQLLASLHLRGARAAALCGRFVCASSRPPEHFNFISEQAPHRVGREWPGTTYTRQQILKWFSVFEQDYLRDLSMSNKLNPFLSLLSWFTAFFSALGSALPVSSGASTTTAPDPPSLRCPAISHLSNRSVAFARAVAAS